MIHIQNREDYQQHVINCTEKIVLLNFWTDWSDACGKMSTTFSLMSILLDHQYNLVYADWDRQKWLADQLCVYGVPTLLVLDQGRLKSTLLGVIDPDALLSCLGSIRSVAQIADYALSANPAVVEENEHGGS